MENKQYLILVDDLDRELGKMEKLEVHRTGSLHRAFSIFIFNSKGELLLQQRADEKYHSRGLWSNTCCSHPHFGETLTDALERRLTEEMGLMTKTIFAFSFIYKASLENELIENEFDHVYIGVSNQEPNPNSREVKNWKYMHPNLIRQDLLKNPKAYTVWFKLCFERVIQYHHSSHGITHGI